MKTLMTVMVAVGVTAELSSAGLDRGDCRVAGSSLQFCDPSGVACTTSAGLPGTCTQRRAGCQCVPNKVVVCHFAKGRGYFVINVAASTVPAHLGHGDCPVDDGVDCTVDICDPEDGCIHQADDGACDDGDDCTADICTDAGCENLPVPGCGGPGACCLEDGGCVEALAEECIEGVEIVINGQTFIMSGTPQDPGTNCDDRFDPQICVQACCLDDGSCQQVSIEECLFSPDPFPGTPQGTFTDCEDVDCSQP